MKAKLNFVTCVSYCSVLIVLVTTKDNNSQLFVRTIALVTFFRCLQIFLFDFCLKLYTQPLKTNGVNNIVGEQGRPQTFWGLRRELKMYVYVYVYVCLCMCMCMSVYVYVYVHVCLCLCSFMCMSVYAYVYVCVCICVCLCSFMCMCMRVYVYVHLCLYMFM